MPDITITLPDGSEKLVGRGSTPADFALSIGERLYNDAVAAYVDGQLVDLTSPLEKDAAVEILTKQDERAQEILLHSTAHLMAQAIKNLYPEAKIAIGPAIEERFYYDIDLDQPLNDGMLAGIEQEMKRLAKENYPVERRELSKTEALELFAARGEDYKLEIIDLIDDGAVISAYAQNDFVDLCRGPHVPSTGRLKYFKLLTTSGAYWRGDERNKMLQRIYGTAWGSKSDLKDYLKRQEEARKRDHRKLGKELDLFSFHSVAPASPFFHPKGAAIYVELETFLRELYYKYGYEEVITPQIFDVSLWKQSGHWDHYREDMYVISDEEADGRDWGVKPMNCPGHTLIYKSNLHSYRDLPLRYADFGRLHRFEKAGVISGLTRVRSFAQDDAHIFCTPEQIEDEIKSLFAMVNEVFAAFGFTDMEIKLSTRPDKFIGDPELWDRAEKILAGELEVAEIKYEIDPGEGAFYGPKIDFFFRDALRRKWQLTTIQLDFSLPERFDLKYVDNQSQEQRPVMIHRAILGSLERFIGVLIEHTGGDFPLWLAPVQAVVLPISEKSKAYGQQVADQLRAAGLRSAIDSRDEKIGAKIRQAELNKTPVMLVVGEREAENGQVAIRRRHQGDLGSKLVADLIEELQLEIKNRERSTSDSQG